MLVVPLANNHECCSTKSRRVGLDREGSAQVSHRIQASLTNMTNSEATVLAPSYNGPLNMAFHSLQHVDACIFQNRGSALDKYAGREHSEKVESEVESSGRTPHLSSDFLLLSIIRHAVPYDA